jgi:hypothetical protein
VDPEFLKHRKIDSYKLKEEQRKKNQEEGWKQQDRFESWSCGDL